MRMSGEESVPMRNSTTKVLIGLVLVVVAVSAAGCTANPMPTDTTKADPTAPASSTTGETPGTTDVPSPGSPQCADLRALLVPAWATDFRMDTPGDWWFETTRPHAELISFYKGALGQLGPSTNPWFPEPWNEDEHGWTAVYDFDGPYGTGTATINISYASDDGPLTEILVLVDCA